MPVSLSRIITTTARAAILPGALGRMEHRVHLSYIDFNLHMNQASYLEVIELARWHWCAQHGDLRDWMGRRLGIVVVQSDIVYRKELRPWQRFAVLSRVIGREGRVGTFQHAIVVGDRVHAHSTSKFLITGKRKVLDEAETAALMDPRIEAPLCFEGDIVSETERAAHTPAVAAA